ncbi:MAG: gamma-glutamylcyclotransferase, partial [Pseudonocardia sp.]
AAPGVVEEHAVWLATPAQVAVLDRCEGRDVRFRLARLRSGEVHTEDGTRIDAPWCYLGHSTARRPLLVDGAPVRCTDLSQAAALALQGVPGPGDGLDAPTVVGTPRPDAA